MNLWNHGKYSSIHFKQLLWQRKALWQRSAMVYEDLTSLGGGWKGLPIQIQVNIPFPILVNKVTQIGTHLEPKEFYDFSLLNVWPEEGLTDHGKDK